MISLLFLHECYNFSPTVQCDILYYFNSTVTTVTMLFIFIMHVSICIVTGGTPMNVCMIVRCDLL